MICKGAAYFYAIRLSFVALKRYLFLCDWVILLLSKGAAYLLYVILGYPNDM